MCIFVLSKDMMCNSGLQTFDLAKVNGLISKNMMYNSGLQTFDLAKVND